MDIPGVNQDFIFTSKFYGDYISTYLALNPKFALELRRDNLKPII